MNVITILGARPQFIKAAVVSRAIARYNESKGKIMVREKIVHTGQHHDPEMSDIFFREMHIPVPAYQLRVSGLQHGAMTGRMLIEVEKLLIDEKPDWVLVYGDTNSTLAGALAAAKLGLPVAHVEAGLRSFNRDMPEELNRIMTDRISSLLLCPSRSAVEHLRNEGIVPPSQRVAMIGDVMYDAALFYSTLAPEMPEALKDGRFEKFALCTLHRAENTDNPARMAALLSGLGRIGRDMPVLLPLHPRTRHTLNSQNLALPSGVHAIQPVGYLEMLALLRSCAVVLTDSGGLQKEAYFFQKNCITMRNETEWGELVEAGCNTIVGADADALYASFKTSLMTAFTAPKDIYGDGNAGDKVITQMLDV